MTPQESENVLRDVFIAFPYIHRYMNEVAEPQQTHAEWCKMLQPLPIVHVQRAVEKWKSGEVEPPSKPWEMGMLPLKLRAVAGKIADQAAKDDRYKTVQSETDQRTRSRGQSNLGRLMKCSMAAGEMLKSGLISESRNREIVADLGSQVGKSDCIVPPEVQEFLRGRTKPLLFSDVDMEQSR